MRNPVQVIEAIDPLQNSPGASPWRCRSPIIALVLFVAFVSPARGQTCDGVCDNNGNTSLGNNALQDLTTGIDNTAIGSSALTFNDVGSFNTAVGNFALDQNYNGGSYNTAIGWGALTYHDVGSYNTATGYAALNGAGVLLEPGPDNNTATGAYALYSIQAGTANTATGSYALYSNTGGSYNTADGSAALSSNTTGIWNTATGWGALNRNTIGSYNAADGLQTLLNNTTGSYNTASGLNALFSNTTGSSNIGMGSGAGGALTTGSDNIDIGNAGVAGESAKIRIGTKPTHKNTYIAGIYGVTVARGIGVIIDSAGHLGTTTSSARFKNKIQPMDKASEAILALEPVTFRYKQELDPEGTPQFGLVAEQVAKVNPDLVARDEEGKPYTVRYEAVNAMLLNEFLKEHRKVEEQERKEQELEATIAQQQKEIKALAASLTEQAAQIRKVSARLATGRVRLAAASGLEASKFATERVSPGGYSPQIVLNNQ